MRRRGSSHRRMEQHLCILKPYATAVFAKKTKGLMAGASFACAMHLDLTIKGHGRMSVNELCIYEVKDGKIVSEQFTARFHI
jgi:hypothetical protein